MVGSGGQPPPADAFDGCDVVVERTFPNQRVAPVPLEVRAAAACWAGGRLHAVGQHAERPAGPRPGGRGSRPRCGRGAGDHPGCRRRVRRQDRHRPGHDRGGLGRPAAGPAGALGGDPEREPARHGARPGPAAHDPDRRHPGRPDPGLPPGHRPGLRGLPAVRAVPAHADPADGQRRVPAAVLRVQLPGGGQQHHADLRLPRRRAARGHRGHRAGGGPVRGRDRPGPGRGPPPQPGAAGTVPVHHPGRRGVRHRGLRGRAGQGAGRGRLRGLRAEQARRRERGDVVQLGIGVSCYVEITAGDYSGGETSRLVVDGTGAATVYTGSSPHGQGHATAFAMLVTERARHPDGPDHRAARSTPTRYPGASAPAAPGRCSSAAARCIRPRSRFASRPAGWPRACSRPATTTS